MLNFMYQFTIGTLAPGEQANLSLWIRTPLSPLSPIQIWSYQSNMSIYSSASFNGSV